MSPRISDNGRHLASEEDTWMSLVLERARQLAKALENCDEYTAYKNALAELEKHEAARLMWRDFQKRQAEVQMARLSGEEVSEEQIEDLERGYDILMMNPYVRDVVIAEFKFTQLFAEVQKIIGEAVGIRFSAPEGSDEAQSDTEKVDSGGPGASDLGAQPQEPSKDEATGDDAQGDDDLKGPRRILVPGRDF